MRKIVSIMLIAALVVLGSACSPAQVGVAQFQPAQRAVASCIVKRESGGNPSAISATNDYGLFQINRVAHKRQFEARYGAPFERKALDPVLNGKYAAFLFSQVGWSPWAGGKYPCW